MFKMKNENIPYVFLKLFSVVCHAYNTNFSLINFAVPRTFLKTTRFSISARGSILWNNYLSKNEEEIDNFLPFKQSAKEKTMEVSTAANLF